MSTRLRSAALGLGAAGAVALCAGLIQLDAVFEAAADAPAQHTKLAFPPDAFPSSAPTATSSADAPADATALAERAGAAGHGRSAGLVSLASASRGSCGIEVCDGIDNDCDGQVDESDAANCTPFYEDRDGDHFGAPLQVGCFCEARAGMAANDFDCDDTRASAHPGAVELCDGEVDNDCNGEVDLCGAFSRQSLQPGDLGVVAFMDRPAGRMDADGEWFAVENRTDRPIELMGLEFRDDGYDRFQIDRSLVIQPRGRVVLARNGDAATNGGIAVDYVYPDFILSNFGDVIEIMNHGEVLERMSYGPQRG